MQRNCFGVLAFLILVALAACGGGSGTTSTPTNVSVTPGDGFVTVAWEFFGDASRFEIYRESSGTSTVGTQALEQIAILTDPAARVYEDVAVSSSESYTYGVSADGGAIVQAGGPAVRPNPGSTLRILFGTSVPDGGGVTSDPPGIVCNTSGAPGCQAEFATISTVTLTAAPVSGFSVRWDNCGNAEPNGPCVVDMATSKSVTVSYEPALTLTVNVDPAGLGRIVSVNDLGANPAVDCTDSCTYVYPNGISIGLSAQSLDTDNYELDGWGGDCSASTGSTCTVTMNGSRTASTAFRLIPPTVTSFNTATPRITSGESASLEWDVSGGGDITEGELEISIAPGIGTVGARTGTVVVTPSSTTEYTLTATNASGTVTDVQTVVVGNGALVESFTATPEAINPGQSSTLAWTVSGTDTPESPLTLTLDPGGIDVTGLSQTVVSPGSTQEFTLTATNEFGSNQDTTTVRVGAPPLIESFSAAEPFINPGDQTSLSWVVSGDGTISSLSVSPDVGDVTGSTSAFVSPTNTTTYTLEATSEFGTSTDEVTVNVGAAPAITSFDVSDPFITATESTTLTWSVTGAEPITLTLDPGGTDVTSQSSEEVSPNSDTTYVLTATSPYGTASADVDVFVGVAPSIASFTASDTTITASENTTLSWSVSGTDTGAYPMTLTLSPGGDVSDQTQATVSPDVDTTYTLTAENAFGSDSDTVAIDVGVAPTVTSFTATPEAIESGQSSTLAWAVDGTAPFTYEIDQGVGTVAGTSTSVSPTSTTTYTLTVTSDFGSDARSTTVQVGDAPSITSFTASDTTITATQDTTLSWNVTGATPMTLTLDPGGDVSGQSSAVVSPDSTTTYTLTATNSFGEATDTLEITVGTAPSITSFTATPSTITEGESSLLEWAVSGDGTFTYEIDQGVGIVAGTSTTVSPTSTTTYTLTVTTDFGSASDTETVTVEAAGTTIAPTSSTCDGVAVGVTCAVAISLLNTTDLFEGLEFDFASSSFDLTGASTGAETSGCLIDAGSTKVVLACESTFGAGNVASLSVRRSASSSSSFVTSNAFVAPDDTTKIAVSGDTLAVTAAN